jgi:hypothetical protein
MDMQERTAEEVNKGRWMQARIETRARSRRRMRRSGRERKAQTWVRLSGFSEYNSISGC